MKKTAQLTALIAIAMTSMFVSSCGPTPASSQPSMDAPSANKIKIKIENKSYHNAVVDMEGPEKRSIRVPARSSSVVYLESGIYQYSLTTKNTRTISGHKLFMDRKRYTWRLGSN